MVLGKQTFLIKSALLLLLSSSLFSLTISKSLQRAEFIMGTLLTLQVAEKDEKAAEQFLARLRQLEEVYSSYRKNSEIKKLEQTVGSWQTISRPLYQLLRQSENLFLISQGHFDVTLGNLLKAHRERTPLSREEKLIARARSGFYFVQFHAQKQRVRLLKKGLSFDFGGIGKGFAVEQALPLLKASGVSQAVINFGGQVTVLSAASSSPTPVQLRNEKLVCYLKNRTLCVSSNRQQPHGHIYDPKKAKFNHSMDRISIAISPQPTVCDALSTIGFLDQKIAQQVAHHFPQTSLYIYEKNSPSPPPPICKRSETDET